MRLFTWLTSTLCVLAACELPSKLGDLPDDSSTEGSSSSDGTDGKTSVATSTATDGEQTTGPNTTDPKTTDEPSTTTTGPMTTGSESTGLVGICHGLDEEACLAAPNCVTYRGTAYDFDRCTPGDHYLGCGEIEDCDTAFTTICRTGTEEVYLVPTSCHPADFEQCDKPGIDPCGGDCGALDESACAVESDFCNPIYGLQHVEKEGLVCVDQTPKYIACISMDGVCPPNIPTLCNIMDPAEKYDIPSGCLVPGFEQCEPEGAQPCQ